MTARPTSRRSLAWWPTVAGIALAGFVALGMQQGSEQASILAASGLVYLAAAALGKPSAWPAFLATFVIITASRSGLAGVDATWVLIALAIPLTGYGLLRGGTRQLTGLPLQLLAMVVVGALAAIALVAGGDLGSYLVAGGLLAHAAWDFHHHRINRVVPRSMSEFCGALDTLLAVAIIVAAARA
jgi:hypothetical protein